MPKPAVPAFLDNCDIVSQEPVATSSSSGDSTGNGPSGTSKNLNGPLSFTCKWQGCHEELSDDPMTWWDHLYVHVPDNLSGPCKWEGCEATGATRTSRFQSKFMFNHITQHMPKKSFKCLMQNCNKLFDTPESLTNHLVKHPQPKKSGQGIYVLDNKDMRKIRDIPAQSADFLAKSSEPGSLLSLQKHHKLEKVLRSIGIVYLFPHHEYFVSVHGIPEGGVQFVPSGFQQRYRLHFPFKPQWVEPLKALCTLDINVSQESVLVWKLPLSSLVFKQELRIFVKELVHKLQTDLNIPSRVPS